MENNSCNTELEKYIWFSFHGNDRNSVGAVARQMENDGVSLIAEGNFGTLQIKPSVCLVFLSKAYLNDQVCRGELDQIRMERIPYLIIYLEDVELPQSLAMRIGRSRALFYHKYADVKDLCRQIYEAHEIGIYDPEAVARRNTELFRKHRKKQLVRGLCVAVITAVVLAVVLLRFDVFGRINGSNESTMTDELHGSNAYVILDTTDFLVRINEYRYFDSLGTWVLQLQLENRTDNTVIFSTEHETINGITVKTTTRGYNRPDGEYAWTHELAPGESRVCRVEYPDLLWKLSADDSVFVHQGNVQVKNTDGKILADQFFVMHPEGEAAAQDFVSADISDATIVYEDEVVWAAYLGRRDTADLFYVKNRSQSNCNVTFYAMGDESDETMFSLAVSLGPDECIVIPAYWSDDVGPETTVRIYYKTELMERSFTSDEIPVLRNTK